MHLTDLVGAAAVGASLVFVWPQVWRLARTRDPDGISVLGAVWTSVGFSLWTAYGLRKGLAPVWVANGQALVGFAIVIVLARHWGGPVARLVPIAAGLAAAVILLAVTVPAEAVGITAVAVGSTGFLPQARVAFTGRDLSGLSVATYALIALTSFLFLLYGALRHDAIVLAPNVLTMPSAAFIAVRAHRSQARLADSLTP